MFSNGNLGEDLVYIRTVLKTGCIPNDFASCTPARLGSGTSKKISPETLEAKLESKSLAV
jgi:hypothetical protein